MRDDYLINKQKTGEEAHKLLLSQTDKDTLIAILKQRQMPRKHSVKIKENFDFFERKFSDRRFSEADLVALCRGLKKLEIVDIMLDRTQDQPQLIYESLNSKGLPLSQTDKIRNYMLMDLEDKEQKRLYQEHWYPMEQAFGEEGVGKNSDAFIRDYLTLKTETIPIIGTVYEEFRRFRDSESESTSCEARMEDMRRYAEYYCTMTIGRESNPVASKENSVLIKAFQDIKELKADVAYPFLLRVYGDYKDENSPVSTKDFEHILRLVESYVVRRIACMIPSNSMNGTFASFRDCLKTENYLGDVRDHFDSLQSNKRFPNDADFKEGLLSHRDLYKLPFNRARYLLKRMENHDNNEPAGTSKLTIEHIMPQNEKLPEVWRTELGENWREVQEEYLHTLGNLTLTGHNSDMGDRSFRKKCKDPKGFEDSKLWLNKGLCDVSRWDKTAIVNRAEKLADRAIEVWRGPTD